MVTSCKMGIYHQAVRIDYGKEVQGFQLSNNLKTGAYADVTGNTSSYVFSRTLIRLGNSAGQTVHSATYLGTSKNGTIYTWSKDGNSAQPSIKTLDALNTMYNAKPQGVGSEKGGGFYNFEFGFY